MERMFFEDWFGLLRILIVGMLAYIALVCLLRLSGKRTLSKMNAFDLVVTVALGSTLATVLLDRSIALAEGVLAFALLTALQFTITCSSVRARWVRRIVKAEPQLLLHEGQFLKGALGRTRVTEEEILAAVRGAGMPSLEDVRAVVLETDGSFSVIRQGKQTGISTLANVAQPSADEAE